MSLFQYLELQAVEPDDDTSELDYFERNDIALYEQTDGDDLADSWSVIMQQQGEDPDS